ncbi:DUF2244 domain-containing protein [Alphaproteobacteria bacterium]|nr:DUF2244 domain-containing protein [Alphaproteobacteria bacterium]
MSEKKSYNFLNLKIYPNRSLTLITLIMFFLIFSLTTAFASLYFILIGAWPVSIFLFADFILLYLAFKKYNQESKIYDRIILKKKLHIINVKKNGVRSSKIIDPTWLRLKIYSDNRKQYLSIISRGKSVEVGKFLNIKELETLAKVIKEALIEREKVLTYAS